MKLEFVLPILLVLGLGAATPSTGSVPASRFAELRLDEIQSEIVELNGIQDESITDADIREATGLVEEYFVHLGEYYRHGGLHLIPVDVDGVVTEKSRFFHDLRQWNSHVRLVTLEMFIEEDLEGMELITGATTGEPASWIALLNDFKHFIVPALADNVTSDQPHLILRTDAALEAVVTDERFEVLLGAIRSGSDPISSAVYAACKRIHDCEVVHPLLEMLGMIATVPATEDTLRLFEDLSRHRDQITEQLAVLVASNDAAGFRVLEYLMDAMGNLRTPHALSADARALYALSVIQKLAPEATDRLIDSRPRLALSTMENLTGLLLAYTDSQIMNPQGRVEQAMRYWTFQSRGTRKVQMEILKVLTGLNSSLEESDAREYLSLQLDMPLQEKLLSYYDMTNYDQMIEGRYYQHYPVVRDTVLIILAPMAYLMDEHVLESVLLSYRRDNGRELSGRVAENLERLEQFAWAGETIPAQ